MKQKGLEPRILCLARLSFKFEGGIKQFSDKKKLIEKVDRIYLPQTTSTVHFGGTPIDGSIPKTK